MIFRCVWSFWSYYDVWNFRCLMFMSDERGPERFTRSCTHTRPRDCWFVVDDYITRPAAAHHSTIAHHLTVDCLTCWLPSHHTRHSTFIHCLSDFLSWGCLRVNTYSLYTLIHFVVWCMALCESYCNNKPTLPYPQLIVTLQSLLNKAYLKKTTKLKKELN